ncbi:interferon-induced GTP-binding protein Mx [Plenodomus tracheiphilus IPT5]|uniref:Interferon-induced GTP-binding protein Mx n=1 Tax=Plenodomus tracheiphilus IPT5 TaxID=1408161 RepID=A0A6A7AV56_9PLEO|nr:interferon-induced GTP-binding protein Mx [Plenodomus tracheiphilus IPT5]
MTVLIAGANGVSDSLQASDTRSLLDTVDSLRSQGISRYIDLPEITVCGEQSSGKSSVLEAISVVKFPSKDNLCTRFATELILRRGPSTPVKISIVPGSKEERSEGEKQKLLDFKVSAMFADLQLDEIIESAKKALGIDDATKAFSSEILLIRAQSDADSDTVKSLMLRYKRSPRSIIIAVIHPKDTLDEGSDMEKFYFELSQNKHVKFRLGWHTKFFSSGIWKSLPSTQVEVNSLKPRLSKILKYQILIQLPVVLAQINDGVRDCELELAALGSPRSTVQEQKRHLLELLADRKYSDPFFGNGSAAGSYDKRPRAVLQNSLTNFAEAMRKNGDKYDIVDDALFNSSHNISRENYILKVKALLGHSRGRELPGTFDPLIIGQLFREQCEPWANLVDKTVDAIIRALFRVVDSTLAY